MNKIASLVLMLCLSCQLVLKLSIVAWFEINQEYIAATLCENKNKPELVCCGKCVLTKQLKKADNLDHKGNKNLPSKAEKTATVAFILPERNITKFNFTTGNQCVQNAKKMQHFGVNISKEIFHPPSNTYS
jgi:hypothetical protein